MVAPFSACLLRLLVTLFLLGAGLSGGLTAAESSPAEEDLNQINQAIDRIEAWLEQARQQRPAAVTRLRAAEQRLASLTVHIADTRQAIATASDRLQGVQAQQQSLVAQQASQVTLIRQLLRAAYREGSQSTVKLVLNQNDPAAAARMLHYYKLINEDRLEKVREYQLTLASLSEAERELELINQDLSAEQLSLDAQLTQLEQERLARQQALAELESAIDLRDRELEGLLADREALQALIEQVQQAMETVPVPGSSEPFGQRKGQLPWPGEGPLLTRFNAPYGNGDLHRQGITIGGPAGSSVRAVHGGRVVFADWLRGSGLLIILDHGDGYLSLYGHNETLTRERGSWVEAGSVIATTGNSGGQRETGIYFEIRYNGRPQNPADWLAPGNF